VLVIAISLVTALAISLTIALSLRGWLLDDLHSHASSVAQSLARSLVVQMARDDVWEAFQAVEAVTAAEGVRYRCDVVVLDAQQRVFVSSDPKKLPMGAGVGPSEQFQHAAALASVGKQPVLADVTIQDESSTLVRLPLISSDSQRMGDLLMAYSHQPIEERYAQAVTRVLAISAGLAAMLAPVGWWLGHRIASPMARATEALHRMARDAAERSRRYAGESGAQAEAEHLPELPEGGEVERLQHSVDMLELQLREKEQLRERFAAAQQLREQAEMANRAKTDFLASMSHELRTPLNGLLGFTQILKRDTSLGERPRRHLQLMEESGQHLQRLIEDALDLARVEAGKFELQPCPVNLRSLFELIADTMTMAVQAKGLEFIHEVDAGLPRTSRCDPKRLQQVVLNLLGNAVKFTDHGFVRLRVRCLEAKGDQARLRIEVDDSGVGIAPEEASRIFLPFEQAGDASKRAMGTGLGLTISRELVRLMGGDIEFQTQRGKGSRFWFDITVPVLEQEEPGDMPHAPEVIGHLGPRKKVLIADDVAPNRVLLEELLGSLGFQMHLATDGDELIRQAQLVQPDLIITDIVMKPMDGLEAVRRLRTMPGFTDIPVIALSATASRGTREQSLDAGANAFLSKPVQVDHLLRQISALLGLRWITRADADATVLAASVQDAVEGTRERTRTPPSVPPL